MQYQKSQAYQNKHQLSDQGLKPFHLYILHHRWNHPNPKGYYISTFFTSLTIHLFQVKTIQLSLKERNPIIES